MAIKAKDPDKQADLVERAKDSLVASGPAREGELLKTSITTRSVKTMSVVGPMKTSLKAIEAALG